MRIERKWTKLQLGILKTNNSKYMRILNFRVAEENIFLP